ncbi:MAG TPA: hypothetical protein VGP88_04385 [Thermoplasmata archaeon]|nr:hypothetical protein [Thermoplasmata archaeon]
MAAARPSTPLPSYALPDPTTSDAVASAKAYHWTDVSLPKRAFPYSVPQRLEGWPVNVLRPRAVDALARAGFPVVMDNAPTFPTKVKPGHAPPTVAGLIVAERGIRYDPARRRMALYRIALFAALAVGAVVGIVFYSTSPFLPLAAIVGGTGLAGVMISATGYGAFDSELVYVAYSTTLDPMSPIPTVETPLTFQVTVAAARVATVNWASKTSSGRSFKAVVPGGDDLRDVPADVLQRILG